ncbi:MAG: C45 family peptidase [Anaerolineae bacterium]
MQIPLIKATGAHYDIGRQIGAAARNSLQDIHAEARATYASRWESLLDASRSFLNATETHLPNVVAELRGAAAGSQLPFEDLFLMSIEELLNEEVRGGAPFSLTVPERARGCSDLAAAPPATVDGHVWLAHNNDLRPSSVEHLYLTQIQAEGEPEILAVTVGGLFISIGFNAAGISLTGNQLYANDSRVGVPRLLMVRDILAQTNFDSALQSALLPERASSYNNLIASADGRMANVEGSATDCELIWADQGVTVHTNHYRSPRMKKYEMAGYDPVPSETRCSRAAYYAETYHGRINRDICRLFLTDHVSEPASVCRHQGEGVTVFSAIIDLTERRMWLARSNPCTNPYQEYTL